MNEFTIQNVVGKTALVTTDEWFYAPDGEIYRAVFGTVNGTFSDKDTLGIETNTKSTNWYLSIGNMIIAGCQLHYAIVTDKVSFEAPTKEMEHDDRLLVVKTGNTRIYNADGGQ
jgi:hypothetical protein